MRLRRVARIMASVLYSIKDQFSHSGKSPYSLLSSSSSNSAAQVGAALCSSLPINLLDRLSLYRCLFAQHTPSLLCVFLASLIAAVAASSWIETCLLTVLLLVLFLFGLVYYIEMFFTFVPNIPRQSRFFVELPNSSQFPVWQVIRLTAPPLGSGCDVISKSFLLLQEDVSKRAVAPTILFLHGNAGNIGHRLPLAKVLYDVCGANIFLLEYRGFGYSNGHPNEYGVYSDAMAALDYLAAGANGEVDGRNIFLFGRSLGGAVAIELGTRSAVASIIRGTIIENTFTSIGDIAQTMASNVMGPLGKYTIPTGLIHNRFESLKKLSTRDISGNAKFLFISGSKDDLVPPQMMTQLANAWAANTGQVQEESWMFNDPHDFVHHGSEGLVRFPEGNHGTTWTCEGFNDVIKRFISLHQLPGNTGM